MVWLLSYYPYGSTAHVVRPVVAEERTVAVDPAIRTRLVAVAAKRLSANCVAALRAVVSPGALFEEAGVSRDTAYRAFRADDDAPEGSPASLSGADRVLVEVCQHLVDGTLPESDLALRAAHEALMSARSDGLDSESKTVAVLRANFEACLSLPVIPAAYALNVACVAASAEWDENADWCDGDQFETARAIAALRGTDYRKVTGYFMPIMQEAMSDQRIRPRPGISVEAIAGLLHALLDGAVQRNAIEPGLLTPELVATAMFRLGMALSEPGSFDRDPRRPTEPNLGEHFDRVVDGAIAAWRQGHEVTLATIGERDDVLLASDVVGFLFPSEADLADSAIRSLVNTGRIAPGSDSTRSGPLTFTYQRETLRRLSQAAVEVAPAVELLRTPPQTGSPFLASLVEDLVAVFATAPDRVRDPRRTAGQLIDLSLEGPTGWHGVEGIFDVIAMG
jgi:hypothetical protein